MYHCRINRSQLCCSNVIAADPRQARSHEQLSRGKRRTTRGSFVPSTVKTRSWASRVILPSAMMRPARSCTVELSGANVSLAAAGRTAADTAGCCGIALASSSSLACDIDGCADATLLLRRARDPRCWIAVHQRLCLDLIWCYNSTVYGRFAPLMPRVGVVCAAVYLSRFSTFVGPVWIWRYNSTVYGRFAPLTPIWRWSRGCLCSRLLVPLLNVCWPWQSRND